jgi:hypothetical protein
MGSHDPSRKLEDGAPLSSKNRITIDYAKFSHISYSAFSCTIDNICQEIKRPENRYGKRRQQNKEEKRPNSLKPIAQKRRMLCPFHYGNP